MGPGALYLSTRAYLSTWAWKRGAQVPLLPQVSNTWLAAEKTPGILLTLSLNQPWLRLAAGRANAGWWGFLNLHCLNFLRLLTISIIASGWIANNTNLSLPQALIPFYAVLFIALGLLSILAALTSPFDHKVAKSPQKNKLASLEPRLVWSSAYRTTSAAKTQTCRKNIA